MQLCCVASSSEQSEYSSGFKGILWMENVFFLFFFLSLRFIIPVLFLGVLATRVFIKALHKNALWKSKAADFTFAQIYYTYHTYDFDATYTSPEFSSDTTRYWILSWISLSINLIERMYAWPVNIYSYFFRTRIETVVTWKVEDFSYLWRYGMYFVNCRVYIINYHAYSLTPRSKFRRFCSSRLQISFITK